MDAAERARTEDVAFQIADILNAGMSAETVVAVLEVIENIKQAARQDERRKALKEAALACLAEQRVFGSAQYATNQPLSSHAERFACGMCAKKIAALAEEVT